MPTVVITGASSGIGHATALEFARGGYDVVLTSRGEEALRGVAAEVEQLGRRALVVAADVARYEQLERVAGAAVAEFGAIDVWVNNAGVGVWSPIESMSADDMRRVVDVTLLGTMHGVRAVLPHFRSAGRGTIINVESAVGERAVPLLSTYCAAKAGVRAFTESLRMEMKASGTKIDVVSILPSSINTPFYAWGASRLGVRPHPLSVVYPPDAVARAIVRAAAHPQRDVYVGFVGKALSIGQRLSPTLIDWYMLQNRRMFRQQLSDTPDCGESNLYASPNDARMAGPFAGETRATSFYTESIESRPLVRRILALSVVAAVVLFLNRMLFARKRSHGIHGKGVGG